MPKPPAGFPSSEVVAWLLNGDPAVRYRTLKDLVGRDESDPAVQRARKEILDYPRIRRIMRKQKKPGLWGTERDIFTWWPKKDTTFWMLGVLGDFGLRKDDDGIERACEYVFTTQLPDGAFGVRPPPKAFDCFTGILAAALARLGYVGDKRLERAYAWLCRRQRLDGGFWCKNTGLPGGPRQAEPSCAFGTLCVLGALTLHPDCRASEALERAASFLLGCWDKRGRIRYAGHDSQIGRGWEKLKYPFTDYRILMYLEILTRLAHVRKDARIREMAGVLLAKQDGDGRFKPESIHKVWGDFDFGQKRLPSRWVTFLAHLILKRIGGARPGAKPS
jgi:hypothetical protein